MRPAAICDLPSSLTQTNDTEGLEESVILGLRPNVR